MRLVQFTNLKRLAIQALAVAGLLAFVVIPTQTASAHYVYANGYLYQSSTDCVWGRSEISHGTGKGYSKSDIHAEYQYNGTHCAEAFERPSGYIKVRQFYYVQVAPGWTLCKDTGWLYNTSSTSHMTVARTHNSTCNGWSAKTRSAMYQLNGTWKGGDLYSGNHAIPF